MLSEMAYSSLERRALEAIKLHLSLRLCEIAPNGSILKQSS